MQGIEHNHSFGTLGCVLAKRAAGGIAAPDFENCRFQRS
jgi:hypothetical protein